MNGLNDSNKRTSISQLLNPASRETTSFASRQALTSINSVQPQQQQQPSQYQNSFQNSFHLRAASWDQVHDDPTKRRSDNGTSSSRTYHHPQMNPVDVYGEHPPRPRLDDPNNFAMDGPVPVWTPAHEIANIAYGAPVIPPMYSDERTGMPYFVCNFSGSLNAVFLQRCRAITDRIVRIAIDVFGCLDSPAVPYF
jgi:hypothetical protein